jgi:hypothetical protein
MTIYDSYRSFGVPNRDILFLLGQDLQLLIGFIDMFVEVEDFGVTRGHRPGTAQNAPTANTA